MAVKGRAYVGMAHEVAITIENSLDYNPDDIQEITLTLTNEADSDVIVQFTKSAAEVQISSNKLLMLYIRPDKVTVSGGYRVRISWVDKNGNPHAGTVVENEIIRFYDF